MHRSLKEKRAVLKRIITRNPCEFNVSVSEIMTIRHLAARALENRAFLPLACKHIELQWFLAFIDSFPEIERTITKQSGFNVEGGDGHDDEKGNPRGTAYEKRTGDIIGRKLKDPRTGF